MQTKITFRNMDSSEELKTYASKKLEKIVKFLENERLPIYIDVVLEPSKARAHHRAELRVKTPRFDLISNYEGPDLHEVLNHSIDVMYHELLEAKRRQIDDRKRSKKD